MIKFEHTEVLGWEHAIRGMRNPLASWDKSDSHMWESSGVFEIGPNDLSLMMRLRNAGSDERKFMRQIFVSVDITAPLYWWKEFDTYKVGTVANSTSTMHTIHKKPLTLDDFSHEHLYGIEDYTVALHFDDERLRFSSSSLGGLEIIVGMLNHYRERYLETKNKVFWWQMIQLLPTSYNQKRTITLNYEVLTNMYHARKAHKLDEWRELCRWIEGLPYSQLITGEG